ncbi:MAG TPA: hypothetical protein VFJ96_11830, partial [Gemmatimonadaceae bacterium]|nr:hypothetical protein [Gemmatimonadaceae bacterium]
HPRHPRLAVAVAVVVAVSALIRGNSPRLSLRRSAARIVLTVILVLITTPAPQRGPATASWTFTDD